MSIPENKDAMSPENVLRSFHFYKLFETAEKVRWQIVDIDWSAIDMQAVEPEMVGLVAELAFAEITTFNATISFLNKFNDDLDFSSWMSVWFYEESRHPMILMRWLEQVGRVFDEKFVLEGRHIYPMRDDKLETIALNIISEVNATGVYNAFSNMTQEPVLKTILKNLAADELRHAKGFYTYAKKQIDSTNGAAAEKIKVLKILLYFLAADDLQHPVLRGTKEIQLNMSDRDRELIQAEQPLVQKRIYAFFSELVGTNLKCEDDVIDALGKLR